MPRRILTLEQAEELGRKNRAAWESIRATTAQNCAKPTQFVDGAGKPIGIGPEPRRPPAKPPRRKPLVSTLPTEAAECFAFIGWTKVVFYQGRPLFDRVVKIPNERGARGAVIGVLTGIGMRKGFLDYNILAPAGRWHGLYLEAKRLERSETSEDQLAWVARLIEFGYHAEICLGAAGLIDACKRYFLAAGCVADGSWIDNTRVQA